MDKLKKNAFAVSIAGTVLRALVCRYLLVIGAIQAELGPDGLKSQLDKRESDYKKILNRKDAGEKQFKIAQAADKDLKEAVEAGREFYDLYKERFNEHHPEDSS